MATLKTENIAVENIKIILIHVHYLCNKA